VNIDVLTNAQIFFFAETAIGDMLSKTKKNNIEKQLLRRNEIGNVIPVG